LEPGGSAAALGHDVGRLRPAIAPSGQVLRACRAAGMLAVHAREGHRPDLSDPAPAKRVRGRFPAGIGDPDPMGRILMRSQHGHDIVRKLAPAPGGPVAHNPGEGAFYATDQAMLRSRGIAWLIVCGVATEVCINITVREADDRGSTASCWRTALARISPNSSRPVLR
jgi:nicotinamidase-related amidase